MNKVFWCESSRDYSNCGACAFSCLIQKYSTVQIATLINQTMYLRQFLTVVVVVAVVFVTNGLLSSFGSVVRVPKPCKEWGKKKKYKKTKETKVQ